MFGTNDVIYVPENHQLVLDDVYTWKRYRIDVRRFGLRIRPEAFELVADRVRSGIEIARHSPRFTGTIDQVIANTDLMLRDLAAYSGQATGSLPGDLANFFRANHSAWWIRLTDLPGESFHAEDYERTLSSQPRIEPHFTYGSVHIAQLDSLDVDLPANDEGHPFSIDVPAEQGLTRWTIPPAEPLPLIHEYCGAHGASAFGRTVNIDTHGNLADFHQFCTPIGILGEKLYATLYVYYGVEKSADVLTRVPADDLDVYMALLEKSHFRLVGSGPTWRIFDRDGDVVHLYDGLESKESEGVETMPPFMLVAAAGGQHDPLHRAELLEAIRDSVGRIKEA